MQTDSNEHASGSASDPKATSLLVSRWIAAFNAHDVERIIELYAEDAELFDTGMRHPRKGHHEIRSWFVQRFRQMPTIQYTPLQNFFDDRDVTVHWLARGQTPAVLRQRWLMRPFEIDGVSIFHMDQGLISWQHGYYDHLRMVEKVLPLVRWLPFRF